MWMCPKCNRNFKSVNQSHMCSSNTIDDIFKDSPDHIVHAFDQVLINVIDWEPCSVGASTKSIVFTKEKAWLIAKPLTKELDLKFYYSEKIEHSLIKKTTVYKDIHAHHIRISGESEVTEELITLLRKGYDFK